MDRHSSPEPRRRSSSPSWPWRWASESARLTAARAVGMTHGQALRYIVLPQALRAVIPSWSNELIGVMKGTAVVFLISVEDLMGQAKIIFGRTFDPIQAYSVVAVDYL